MHVRDLLILSGIAEGQKLIIHHCSWLSSISILGKLRKVDIQYRVTEDTMHFDHFDKHSHSWIIFLDHKSRQIILYKGWLLISSWTASVWRARAKIKQCEWLVRCPAHVYFVDMSWAPGVNPPCLVYSNMCHIDIGPYLYLLNFHDIPHGKNGRSRSEIMGEDLQININSNMYLISNRRKFTWLARMLQL